MSSTKNTLILGISLIISFIVIGIIGSNAVLEHKSMERSVTVKGLSEREYLADTIIWPIQFTAASNDLSEIYETMETSNKKVIAFLREKGIEQDEISSSAPSITDKSAQRYGSSQPAEFRYTATQAITVYSNKVEQVRRVMGDLADLGKEGIVLSSDDYQAQPEYLFTRLNEVKPEMIEEATKKAREVAEKFATDSNSQLGKIKQARQGQFSISARDRHNPHLKNVRVVSTIEYYLSD
ncbi:SIMPL domain-containing protein [Idiomarina sp. PL1-037]|uniref:SIMPL domain-containing protein n=1 Tax=Idiomarina TaxID=135575 RepID=UPI00294B2D9B|nr:MULTISPECIES: SIMPL domain-containing protein [unclassified Idiomarina]MDV6328959.1 SIMPL domain-containing protein [Idiomarina sp. Sol25]WQC52216.1 SIMPL domain-containing protein [Idiomarina sp. PL1-037]